MIEHPHWLALVAVSLLAPAAGACRDDAGGDAPCSSANHFPAHVIQSTAGGPDNTNKDPSQAEGPPNCGHAMPSDISLGGGFIVMDLGCTLDAAPGPELEVWESDASYPPCSGLNESYNVLVSADGTSFMMAGSGLGPTEIDVTVLPSFRYVKIQDTEGITTGATPGADIDALEVLNAK